MSNINIGLPDFFHETICSKTTEPKPCLGSILNKVLNQSPRKGQASNIILQIIILPRLQSI